MEASIVQHRQFVVDPLRISRMRLLDLSRTHGNTIISLPFFEIYIGFQFVKESSSNWRPWSTNVSTVCVHPTLQRTAYCCLPLVGRQHLQSAGRLELLVPRTRTVTFGLRAFTVGGPGVWNSLPSALREPTLSFNCFRR